MRAEVLVTLKIKKKHTAVYQVKHTEKNGNAIF